MYAYGTVTEKWSTMFFTQYVDLQNADKQGFRIDLIRIRIQHFCSIRIRFRIRIQAKTELSKTISFSNFFETKIWVKSNKKYRCYSSKIFPKSS
jgi:hypothetical protein